jgi:hypothetical protein
MNQLEAMRAMNRIAAHAQVSGAVVDVEALQRAAKAAAAKALATAQSSGHSVAIKVTARTNGVRISVTGSKAHRYRTIVGAELERLSPTTAADLKAQIIRKIR